MSAAKKNHNNNNIKARSKYCEQIAANWKEGMSTNFVTSASQVYDSTSSSLFFADKTNNPEEDEVGKVRSDTQISCFAFYFVIDYRRMPRSIVWLHIIIIRITSIIIIIIFFLIIITAGTLWWIVVIRLIMLICVCVYGIYIFVQMSYMRNKSRQKTSRYRVRIGDWVNGRHQKGIAFIRKTHAHSVWIDQSKFKIKLN